MTDVVRDEFGIVVPEQHSYLKTEGDLTFRVYPFDPAFSDYVNAYTAAAHAARTNEG